MGQLSSQFALTVADLRGSSLQLGQPAEAGWHFYADDSDPQIAASLASIWAQAFVDEVQDQVDSGTVNDHVRLEVTPVTRPANGTQHPNERILAAGAWLSYSGCVCNTLFIKTQGGVRHHLMRVYEYKTYAKQRHGNYLNKFASFLWGAVLLAVPVTSFRWFPFLGEGTFVRPLALYPLVLLLPLLLVQAFRKKIHLYWAGAFVALAVLILFIFTATSFGGMFDPLPLRGQIYFGRAIRALVTLLIGVAFFIAAVWMNKDENDLRFSARWIFAGMCLDIFWSGLQAVTFIQTCRKRNGHPLAA
ncbi:MAG: hypothetical protein IPL17_12870 [Anaerolineales bacterium]|nr:hypothetical protein [Anaerolineales bacterium]